MFTVDKALKYIDHSGKKMLSILRSSNQPLIAAADRPAEPTESFICSYQNSKKKIETYIMLHLVKSGIRVFYRSDKGEFSPNEFTEVEVDALEFLESMGFTMDNIGFQKIKESKKNELFASLPIFIDPQEMVASGEEEEEDFVRTDDMAEDLEDVLSDEDLESIELSSAKAKEDEKGDLLDNIEEAVEELPAFQESEFSDEKALDELQREDKISPVESQESIRTMAEEIKEVKPHKAEDLKEPFSPRSAESNLSKIVRIISSF